MHWLTQPGTSLAEETRISSRPAGSCGRSRACATAARTSGRRIHADEVYGVDFGENWISVDPEVDYDETLAVDPGDRRGLPGPLPRRADLPARADPGGADRGERGGRRAHLRSGPRRPAGEGRRDRGARSRASTASSTRTSTSRTSCRTSRSSSTSPPRASYGLKPGDIRRPASTLLASEEVSDICVRAARRTTSRLEHPAARDSVTDVEKLPIDTPNGGRVRWPRWPTCGWRRRRTPSSGSTSRAASTSAPTSRAATSARSSPRWSSASRRCGFPLGYHAEVLGESTELSAAQDRLLLFGAAAAIAILLLLQAAFGSLRLAAAHLPAAADGARRRRARRVARRRRALARLARRLPDRVRHRRTQRHPADQPLPASRARRKASRSAPTLVLRGAQERLAPILMTASRRASRSCRWPSPAASPATRSSIRWPSSSSAAWSPRRC